MDDQLEIVIANPPIIDEARKIFKLPEGTIFTYGKKIYNPSGRPIDNPLYVHEKKHSEQQGDSPDLWWRRYLSSSPFRASQEIICYQLQYRKAKEQAKDREKLNRYLVRLAKDLSGEMYANLMTFSEALETIKNPRFYTFKI